MDIIYILNDLWRTRNLQEWINNRFKDPQKDVLDRKYIDKVITTDGIIYSVSNQLHTIAEVYNEYFFDDICKDDIVIDIGADIGAFSLPASELSNHVFAVEPIMVKELQKNIALNNAKVSIIESALGNGDIIEVKWNGIERNIKSMTLSEIINYCGGCDFLKCDCEGGEYFIKEEEIKNIRRIEMEYHRFGSHRNEKELIKMLSKYHTIKVDKGEGIRGLGIIHAKRK